MPAFTHCAMVPEAPKSESSGWALTTADNHVIYKLGSKEIASAQGMSLTFMAKFNEREGNSCHIHLSVRGLNDEPVMADAKDPQGLSALGKSFIAGQLKYMREMTLFFAPNINFPRVLSANSYSFVIVSARVGQASIQSPQKIQRK